MSEPAIQTPATRDQIVGAFKDVLGPVAAEALKEMQTQLLKAMLDPNGLRKYAPGMARSPFEAPTQRVIQTASGFVGTYRPKITSLDKATGQQVVVGQPMVGEMDGETEFYPCGFVPRAMWALMKCRMLGFGLEKAGEIARQAGFPVTAKALDTTVIQDGGALIPAEFADEIIEALIPYSVVRSAGPTMMPIKGQMSLGFINAQATGYWVGENVAITKSQPTTGAITARENKLGVLIPVSNEMLRLGGSRVESAIMRHMARVAAAKEDSAYLTGEGTQNSPKGFRHWAVNTVSSNGTPTVATITTEGAQAQQKLADAYVLQDKPHWFMAPRSKYYLRALRTSNGEYAFPEMQQGNFLGNPASDSPQIPITESTNQSRVYLANMSDIMIFDGSELRMESFPGGAYDSGSGTIVSGITSDQTVLRLTKSTDLVPQYRGNEITMITGVVWGA